MSENEFHFGYPFEETRLPSSGKSTHSDALELCLLAGSLLMLVESRSEKWFPGGCIELDFCAMDS